jgi:hypothetical protein
MSLSSNHYLRIDPKTQAIPGIVLGQHLMGRRARGLSGVGCQIGKADGVVYSGPAQLCLLRMVSR